MKKINKRFLTKFLLSPILICITLYSYADNNNAAIVAFLMPDHASTRYEEHDYPGFKDKMNILCKKCRVIYQNADANVAKQQQQFNSVISQGAKVIVLNPVDSSAAVSLVKLAQSQGVKVIAYDRPIPNGGADFYVSFDNEGIGQAIAKSLVNYLNSKGVSKNYGGLIQINGSPVDAAAGLIKKGIHTGIDNSGYKLLSEFDTPDWVPSKAQAWAAGQVTRFGKKIVGVVAANDGTAGGAIAAFKASGINPIPPVTGNDATIAALQLIISGDQYNTISKPSEIVASAAASVVIKLLNGEKPHTKTTLYNTPSKLFIPSIITSENLKAEIIDKGVQTAKTLCTGRYAKGCARLGIK